MEATRKKTIGEMSSDARVLCNFLDNNLKPGETVEYGRLSEAINRDVQGEARGLLLTARKHFEREHNCILECVRGFGLNWSDQRTGLMDGFLRHVRRSSRKVVSRVINSMDGKELPATEKNRIFARVSLIGALRQFSGGKAIKKLETKMEDNQASELAFAETIKLFE